MKRTGGATIAASAAFAFPCSSEAEVTSTGTGSYVDKIKVKFPANCAVGDFSSNPRATPAEAIKEAFDNFDAKCPENSKPTIEIEKAPMIAPMWSGVWSPAMPADETSGSRMQLSVTRNADGTFTATLIVNSFPLQPYDGENDAYNDTVS